VVTNNNYGGLPIAKWTNMRTGSLQQHRDGLHDGINLRMMRYSDVLLRAASVRTRSTAPPSRPSTGSTRCAIAPDWPT
jgi:hypothetical protein